MVASVGIYNVTELGYLQPLVHLLSKALEQNLRCVVLCADEEQLAELDHKLWLSAAGFLAHGLASDNNAALQPICLATELVNPNSAQVLVCCGVEPRQQEQLQKFNKCLDLVRFDLNNKSNSLQKRVEYYLSIGSKVASYFYQNGKWNNAR